MDISALPATTSLASTALRPASAEIERRAHGHESPREARRPHPERATGQVVPPPRLPLVSRTDHTRAPSLPPGATTPGATFQGRQASRLYAEVAQLEPSFDGELLGRIDLHA